MYIVRYTFFVLPCASVVSASNNVRHTPLPVHLRHNSSISPNRLGLWRLLLTL